MKNILLLFFFIGINGNVLAQEYRPQYVSHWTYLFKKADQKSEKIGIFATEAAVKLLDSSTDFYKVQANNLDVGYIPKQKITKSMRGKKNADEPSHYFYRGSQGSQCPHLFVQVSGLRARSKPNKNGAVKDILPINKMICVEYLPMSPTGWVYIGGGFQNTPTYIQYQFLGKELSFKETLQDFKRINKEDKPKQKIFLERLVELGWNSSPENTLQALQLFKKFHEEEETLTSIPEIDFDLYLAKSIQNPLSSKEKAEFNYNGIYVVINGKKVEDHNITEKEAQSLNLKKITDYSSLPNFSECGWDPKYAYVNDDLTIILNFEEYNNKINGIFEKLDFFKGNTIIIDGFKIDQNTSEEEFIKKFGKILSFDRFNDPDTYYLPEGDSGLLTIKFRGRKAVGFQRIYYC